MDWLKKIFGMKKEEMESEGDMEMDNAMDREESEEEDEEDCNHCDMDNKEV